MTDTNGSPKQQSHPIHEMMSRTGSFPVEVAYRFLEQYCEPSSVVLDPFCGKGSSLLAARLLGHSAYGVDIAPESVICSAAKLTSVSLASFEEYISDIRLGRPNLREMPSSVMTFFHPSTLQQILSLRNRLQKDMQSSQKRIRSKATFGMGCLLGILHGHASYSLSVPSAHAFSMAPNYVARFAEEHGLSAPVRDVKECILEKARHLLRRKTPKVVTGEVRLGCARSLSEVFPHLIGNVDTILTSPPYLSAQTYAKDNWLRLWLLGYDHRILKSRYIETGSVDRYSSLMTDVFRECHKMLKLGGILICIAGDVRLKSHTNNGARPQFATGSYLATIVNDDVEGMTVTETGSHTVESTSRYFHSLSKSNGHTRRKLTERFFLARKDTQ